MLLALRALLWGYPPRTAGLTATAAAASLSATAQQSGVAALALAAAPAALYANDRVTHARAGQVVLPALLSVAAAAYTSQYVLAGMIRFNATAHASQSVLASLTGVDSRLRASQVALEILIWNQDILMPAIFPVLPGLAYSVIKRPSFFNASAESISGREVRVAYAVNPLWEWDLTFDYLPDEPTASSATASDLKQLIGFYLSQGGGFQGFLFKDPDDHAVVGQVVGTSDGATTNYTLIRTYGGSDGTGSEPVGYVDTAAAFTVYLDGAPVSSSAYSVLTTAPVNQVLAFASAPAAGHVITVTYTYYYYARFKEDTYEFEKFMDKLWSQRLLTLKSLRG